MVKNWRWEKRKGSCREKCLYNYSLFQGLTEIDDGYEEDDDESGPIATVIAPHN